MTKDQRAVVHLCLAHGTDGLYVSRTQLALLGAKLCRFLLAFYILLRTLEIKGCTKVSQWQPVLSFVDLMGQLKHFQGEVVSPVTSKF